MSNSTREYLPFVDWMKALGIAIIVIGHVAARPINGLTPPIYPKQLGVAFFIFVLGFSLARENRRPAHVLFNRAFEVYLIGVPIALVLTVTTFIGKGSLALGNYLPFALGANLLFDNFPPNPTTWYIGTYIHVLILWALFVRGRQMRPWMFVVALPAEILVRAFLFKDVGYFTAYMLATDWVTVFLLGTLFGQAKSDSTGISSPPRNWLVPAGLLVALAVLWPTVMDRAVVERSFPFMKLSVGVPWLDTVFTSACVSALYLAFSWLVFLVTRNVMPPGWIRLLSRNTLVVFIAHMPVFYALEAVLSHSVTSYAVRAAIDVAACLPGLALVSEGVWSLVHPRVLRDMLAARFLAQQGAS